MGLLCRCNGVSSLPTTLHNHKTLAEQRGRVSSKRQPQILLHGPYSNQVKMCGSLKAFPCGKWVHAQIINHVTVISTILCNLLLDMYRKCGSCTDAVRVFEYMGNKDVISWTTMIAVSLQYDHYHHSFRLVKAMKLAGLMPNGVTFLVMINISKSPRRLLQGKLIHSYIILAGFQNDIVVMTSLISMYGKCESLENAEVLFQSIWQHDVVSWTAMIGLYSQLGHGEDAFQLFRQLHLGGLQPNMVTFTNILDACADLADLAKGKLVHSCMANSQLESEPFVQTALTHMYSSCGSVKNAYQIFIKVHQVDVACWNAVLGGYTQNEHEAEALVLFRQMQKVGIKPDRVTFIACLDACAGLINLVEGRLIHAHIFHNNIDVDIILENSIVNMYGKCGALGEARKFFNNMSLKNPSSWTAMIGSYTQHGYSNEALSLYDDMHLQGMKPDEITFVSILSACSRGGLIDRGNFILLSISGDYGTMGTMEHYRCIIDLLGRAGWLDEVEDIMTELPFQQDARVWMTFLAACNNSNDSCNVGA